MLGWQPLVYVFTTVWLAAVGVAAATGLVLTLYRLMAGSWSNMSGPLSLAGVGLGMALYGIALVTIGG